MRGEVLMSDKEEILMSQTEVELDKSSRIVWQHFFGLALIISFVPTMFEFEYSLAFEYLTHKTLHILGGIMFTGNMLVSAVWMFFARKTKDKNVILFTSKTSEMLDRYVAAPGIVLILFNGILMASLFGGAWETQWLSEVFARFVIVTGIWILYLVPKQKAITKGVQAAVDNNTDLPETFLSDSKRWIIWSSVVVFFLFWTVQIMITKPSGDF